MNAGNRSVELRTKLLVAEHGRTSVIAALAAVEDVEYDVIEREIDEYRTRQRAPRRRPRKTLADLLRDSMLEPERLALVRRVGCEYENKRYLPELWRVRRFLESKGVDAGGLRSRAAALPRVIDVLGRLPLEELRDLAAGSTDSSGGDLGIIANQILGSATAHPKASSAPVKGSGSRQGR